MTLAGVKRRLPATLAAIALLAVAGCAYLERKQGELIFRPSTADFWGYRSEDTHFQERWIAVGANGEKLHAWWSPAADPNAPAMLYLHGARWNLSGSAARIPRWNRMGFSVLAIDYRGFGQSSTREPTEQSAYEDGEAAWAELARIAPKSRRFIYGHSLGGAVATELAIRHPEASGLILEAAFTNIPELLHYYPWGFLPVGGLVTQRFDNLERIGKVSMPILFAHGTSDSTVPFFMSEKLYEAAHADKRLFRADGGSHHNLTASYFGPYSEAVRDFFHLPAPSQTAATGG